MQRIPEPELMLDEAQAAAYLAADFAESHDRFVDLLLEKLPGLPSAGRCLDLGCGPGDVTRRFARVFPDWKIDAVDGSPAMLALAEEYNAAEDLQNHIRCFQLLLPAWDFPSQHYDLILCGSVLHHLQDPAALWSTIRKAATERTAVFVRDLHRPESPEEAETIVQERAASEPEVLRRDYYNSLLAAYLPEEVRQQLDEAGISTLQIGADTDRHFIVWGHVGDG